MDGRWEYQVLRVSTQNLSALSATMNTMGSVGWEVVGFAAADKTLGLNEYAAILKRRKYGPPAPDGDGSPGWYPDPLGRHVFRWWDGLRWEAGVHDDGQNGTDYPTDNPAAH